jgi:hypothetical protein
VRAFLVTAFLLIAFGSAQAQVVFDANSTADVGSSTAVSSLSNSNLTIGSGNNRALIAQVALGNNIVTVSSCVWDAIGANQSLTLIKRQTDTASGIELWGLVNPVSGNKTLTCNFSGSVAFDSLNGLSFTGVNQTGGITTFYNSAGTTGSSTASSITIASATGDAIVEIGMTTQIASAPTQTQVYLDNTNGGYGQRAAGAASVSFGWTITPTAPWVEATTAIKAASGVIEHNLSLMGVGH